MVRTLPLILYILLLILLLASLTMYQRARKLEDVITDATSFVTLAESQLEALSVATNALSLVDEKSTWVVMPVMPDAVSKNRLLFYFWSYAFPRLANVKNSQNTYQRPSIYQASTMLRSFILRTWNMIVHSFEHK